MKKLKPILLVLIGFIVGWTSASYIANNRFDQWTSTWPPELWEQVSETSEFMETLSVEEMEQLREDMRVYSENAVSEFATASLHKALLSIQIRQTHKGKGVDGLEKILTEQEDDFLEDYHEGRYTGSMQEDLATTIAHKIEGRNTLQGQPNSAPNPSGSVL